jgi:antitoxin component of MazEF toxin-antitoxin module
MAKVTKLTPATSKKESLRTTVPRSIVEQFDLTSGDSIEWKMEVRDAELIVVVRPMKRERL